ncbi:MAG TPA: hypothetical protein VIL32_09735 [Steroidobacteraceae bacterium]
MKYRWMGHGNGDLMVNPDGTPHKDSCPAEAFREIRKRVMKSPRAARAYKGPPLDELIPGGTREQIIERLFEPLERKQSRAKTPPVRTAASSTQPASATGESHQGDGAAAPVAQATSQNVATDNDSGVQVPMQVQAHPAAEARTERTPAKPEASALPDTSVSGETRLPRSTEADAPRRPRGRPRRDPAQVSAAKEKAKAAQREIARCPTCAVPLITDLNTGAQVCLTCNYQLEVVVETADV